MLRAVFGWLKLQHVWHYTKLAKAWKTKATCREHSNASTTGKHQQCTSVILYNNNRSEILAVLLLNWIMQCIFFLSCRPGIVLAELLSHMCCLQIAVHMMAAHHVDIMNCRCPNTSPAFLQSVLAYMAQLITQVFGSQSAQTRKKQFLQCVK